MLIAYYSAHAKVMLAFIPGTLIGLVVQPVVGVLSDSHRSRFGRRRPFIATFSLLLVACYTLLANAFSLGTALGDLDPGGTSGEGGPTLRPAAAGVALVSFWLADFAINACQLPVRVLATWWSTTSRTPSWPASASRTARARSALSGWGA